MELSDYVEETEFKVIQRDDNKNNFDAEDFDNYDEPDNDSDSDDDYKPPNELLQHIEKIKVETKTDSKEGIKKTTSKLKLPQLMTGESISCPYCEKTLKAASFRMHLTYSHREEVLKHHPDIEFKTPCPECDMLFAGVVDLDKHTTSVHGKATRAWRCNICEHNFNSKPELRRHRRDMHKEELAALGYEGMVKDKDCPYCEKKFDSSLRWKIHIFGRHKDMRHLHPDIQPRVSCDECGEGFFDNQTLRLHVQKNHSDVSMSQCPHCPKSYKHKSALSQHLEREHDDSVHICHHCSREYQTKHALTRHLKTQHDENFKQVYKFQCQQCKGGKYQSEDRLKNHILQEHSNKEYMCAKCPMVFRRQATLRDHKAKNHEEKTIKCDQCGMMFTKVSYHLAHVKSKHLKIKDKNCPHCGEAFFLYSTFQKHVRRHTDDRPFSCEECGKAYFSERDLVVHKRHHHDQPFPCDLCEKKCPSNAKLQDHKRKIHDGIELNCRFGCGWKSMSKWMITRHEKGCDLNPVPNTPFVKRGKQTREEV